MTEDAFHACDGKFVLMQLVECKPSWHSALVPEVGDHWATFRLFDGVYDEPPEAVNVRTLKPAEFICNSKFSPYFYCESSMYYFKHRQARVLGNDVSSLKDLDPDFNSTACVFFGINRPWVNADSELLAAMGKEPLISIYQGFGRVYRELVYDAISYGEYDHRLTKQENRERFYRLTEAIAERALAAEKDGGIILQLTYGGVMAGVLTVREHLLEDLYIQGDLRNHGFGTRLMQNGLSHAGQGAYLNVPVNHAVLIHICEKLGLSANDGAEDGFVRYVWEARE